MHVTRRTPLVLLALPVALSSACGPQYTSSGSGSSSSAPYYQVGMPSQGPTEAVPPGPYPPPAGAVIFEHEGAGLRGDIGRFQGFDDDATYFSAYFEPSYGFTSVEVTVERPDNKAGMALLTLLGAYADLATAPSGVYRQHTYGEAVDMPVEGSEVELDGREPTLPVTDDDQMNILICGGREAYAWEADVLAEEVVVEIEDPVTVDPPLVDDDRAPEPIVTRRVTFATEAEHYDANGNVMRTPLSGSFTLVVSAEPRVD